MSGPAVSGVVSVDGVVTPIADGRVSVMDHGFLFGDSIYEVVRTLAGRPVAMPEHLERLRRSAEMLYLKLPWTDAEIVARARAAFVASKFPDAYIRMVVSRGVGPMTLLPDWCASPSLIVYVMPLVLPTAADLEKGVTVAVPERLRNDRRSLAPAAKTGNYLNNALALIEAKRAGADDAVMVNPEGFVSEATTANVGWVKGGVVHTPSHECGILAGITRALLLEEMASAGLRVVEGRFPVGDFRACDEAFLTGTIRGVSPVVKIDGHPVGDGRPGPVTRRIMSANDRALMRATREW